MSMTEQDWNQLIDTTSKFRKTDTVYDQNVHKEFCRFTRAALKNQLGIGNLSDKHQVLEKELKKRYGDDYTLGIKEENQPWSYSVQDVYDMLDVAWELHDTNKKNTPPNAYMYRTADGAYILVVCNQKGGAGKTSTAVNLAIGSAIHNFSGMRILLIDLDPQGSVQKFMDGRSVNVYQEKTLSNYLTEEYTQIINDKYNGDEARFIKEELILDSIIPNLKYCSATTADTAFSTYINNLYQYNHDEDNDQSQNDGSPFIGKKNQYDYNGENCYKLIQEKFIDHIKNDFDLVIFDVAPHNNTAIHAACYTANHLLVTVPPRQLDLDSTILFTDKLHDLYVNEFPFVENYSNKMNKIDILRTMYVTSKSQPRKKMECEAISIKIKNAYGSRVLDKYISESALYTEMSKDYNSIYLRQPKKEAPDQDNLINELDGVISHIIQNMSIKRIQHNQKER